MDTQATIDLVVFVGSALGATSAALIPYWAKVRSNEALGLPAITFDKKFAGTLIIAFVIGIATAFITFDSVDAAVNPNDTLVKIFVVAVVTSATSNVGINSFLNPSSTTQLAVVLKAQNKILNDELNTLNAANVKSLPEPIPTSIPVSDNTTIQVKDPVKQPSV